MRVEGLGLKVEGFNASSSILAIHASPMSAAWVNSLALQV